MPTTLETLTREFLAFRCNRCWKSNRVACEHEGQAIACWSCGSELTVPPATPERIAMAKELLRENATIGRTVAEKSYDKLSERELFKLVQRENFVPISNMHARGAGLASRLSRLMAQIIDGFVFFLTPILGVLIAYAGVNAGFIPAYSTGQPVLQTVILFGIVGFPFLILLIVQLNMIATQGQSIGKLCLFIRVIDNQGNPPGFIRGVVMREFSKVLLVIVPVVNLIDPLLIFSQTRRCLHDHMAGTTVVQC
ncbi:MAG: RDD family protein [Aureliella sp.]